jgi:hypothetical protein
VNGHISHLALAERFVLRESKPAGSSHHLLANRIGFSVKLFGARPKQAEANGSSEVFSGTLKSQKLRRKCPGPALN